MKEKIIKSYSNEDTGVSVVTIQNKYGKFYGMAFCHPDDMENFSAFAGERYAETRARAAFADFRYKQEKIKLQTIQNLIKDIDSGSGTSMEYMPEEYRRKINLKLRDYTQSVEDWKNLSNYLIQNVKQSDKLRQELLEKCAKNKQDKEN